MNPSVMERELAFQQAKLTEKQRPHIIGLIEDLKWKAMVTGIVIGFCICASALFAGTVIARLILL